MVFQPGQSGNPAGRPPGSRNKSNPLRQKLLEGRGDAILNKLIELAEGGALPAIRICVDQMVPARKDHPVVCELPTLNKPADSVAAMAVITNGVSAGELTPAEAADLAKVVDRYVQALKAHDFSERLSKFEAGEDAGDND